MVSERKEIDFLKQFSDKFSYIQLYFCFERLQRNLTKITFVNEIFTVQDLNSHGKLTLRPRPYQPWNSYAHCTIFAVHHTHREAH